MNDSLHEVLDELLAPDAEPNPVLDLLIRDYARFHAVLAVVGGMLLVGTLVLSWQLVTRYRRARRSGDPARRFERRTYAALGVVAAATSLFLGLVVAANLSTALRPLAGFAGSVHLLGRPDPGTRTGQLQQAVVEWLQSGSTEVPPLVLERVDERLAWQAPKAVVCSVLLVLVVVLTAWAWRSLIRRTRAGSGRLARRDVPLLAVAVIGVAAALVLVLMVMGNTQGALAPLSLTLFLG